MWLKLKITTEGIYVKYHVSRAMGWAGNVARVRKERCIQCFVGKSEGRRPLGRPKCTWEENIKKDLQEKGWAMYWNDLAQNRNR
jgi:hypothetical protein